MDNRHCMEPWIANAKQEREVTLDHTLCFQSEDLNNVGFQSKVPSRGHTCMGHCGSPPPVTLAPACMLSEQEYHISPFSQLNACDGSLSDMLLPYQYAKTVVDVLLEHEKPLLLQQQLPPRAQSQFNKNDVNDGDGIVLNEDFQIDDGVIINNQQLASAMPKMDQDAQSVMGLPPLRRLVPAPPPHTRRPPMRKGTPSYRENHIHSERQRRQDMTSLFSRLKSTLPHMQHDDLKGDRCTILEHVIEYVQELDKKVQALGKVKAELMEGEEGALRANHRLAQQAALASAESVSVRSWGQVDIFITFNCPKQRGLWPNLLALLQDTLQLDVQNVALSSTPLLCVHSIYAKVMGDDNEEVCCKVKKTLRDFVADHAYSNHIRS